MKNKQLCLSSTESSILSTLFLWICFLFFFFVKVVVATQHLTAMNGKCCCPPSHCSHSVSLTSETNVRACECVVNAAIAIAIGTGGTLQRDSGCRAGFKFAPSLLCYFPRPPASCIVLETLS